MKETHQDEVIIEQFGKKKEAVPIETKKVNRKPPKEIFVQLYLPKMNSQ
jgi:hypothetical protein